MFFVLAVLCAYSFLGREIQAGNLSMDRGRLALVSSASYLAAYLGARLFAILVEQKQPLSLSLTLLFEPGAMTLYGGLLAGGVLMFALSPHKLSVQLELLDSLALATCLGIAIGRVGCFLNGDDYGLVMEDRGLLSWLIVTFPNHENPQPRLAVQLIESFYSLALFGGFGFLRRKGVFVCKGSLGLSLVMAYSLYRFMMEFLRDDPRGQFFATQLSPAQGLSLVFFTLALLAYPRFKLKK